LKLDTQRRSTTYKYVTNRRPG